MHFFGYARVPPLYNETTSKFAPLHFLIPYIGIAGPHADIATVLHIGNALTPPSFMFTVWENNNNNNNNYNVFIQLVYKFTFDFEFLDFSNIFSIFSFSYLVGRELGS